MVACFSCRVKAGIAICLLGCALLPSMVVAQVSTHIPYDELIKRSRTFAQLDENLFGDKVNLQDGGLSFVQNDVVLDTNSTLKVVFGRKTPSAGQGLDEAYAIFGLDWEPNIPFMMGTYDTRDGWNSNGSKNRCSNGFVPFEHMGPYPNYYTYVIKASMWWHGITINIPGHGEEKLLKTNAGQTLPTDGKTYYGTTRSAWRVSCLPSIKNGQGEGFAVTVPDGTIYYFDWMATRNAIDLTGNGNTDPETGDSTDPLHLLAPLTDVYLYATKAVDRFGNSITYTYDQERPNRITSITSSDGVRLDVDYNANGQVSVVKSGSKQWSYAYVSANWNRYQRLSSITQPDHSMWQFAKVLRTKTHIEEVDLNYRCSSNPGSLRSTVPPDTAAVTTITMTHPSGAKGEFKLRPLFHGTNNTPGGCDMGSDGEVFTGLFTYGVPAGYVVESLFSKRLFGPGMSDRSWGYMYYPSWSFDPAFTSVMGKCSNPCPTTTQTTVTSSDGTLRRYTFGNSYYANAGQLLSESIEQGGGGQLRTYAYLATAVGQPFPDNVGEIPTGTWFRNFGDAYPYLYGNPFSYLNRPVNTVKIQQDGVLFERVVNSFDVFARPTNITKSSTPAQ